jgi:hypothetical protein
MLAIDPDDIRMRVGRANEDGAHLARQLAVFDITATTLEQSGVFPTTYAIADAGTAGRSTGVPVTHP